MKFSPEINEGKATRFVGLGKIKGEYSKVIYPNGSAAPERAFIPDYEKVDKMIVN